jgi:plasmid stability protein
VAQLVVRNVDEDVKARLKQRADAHGQSMEEEVRQILRAAVLAEPDEQFGLGTRITKLFEGIGLKGGELPTLPRQAPKIPRFE